VILNKEFEKKGIKKSMMGLVPKCPVVVTDSGGLQSKITKYLTNIKIIAIIFLYCSKIERRC